MALSCCFLSALIVCGLGFAPCTADTDTSFAALVGRIEALEEQGKIQQTIISEQSEKIVQQEMKIKELMDWKEQQLYDNNDNPPNVIEFNQPGNQPDNPGVRNQSEKPIFHTDDLQTFDNLEEAEKQIQSLRSDNGVTRKMKHSNIESKRTRNTETRRALLGQDPVAFHAVMNGGDVSVGLNQRIVFNHVNINLGGGYHNLHGVFISPSSGLYIFSTSVYSHGDEDMDVDILKNGVRLASAGGDSRVGRYDQGSVTIVTKLVAGDEIWVSHKYGALQKIYGNYYTSFMGCLVVPM